jgi:hypothetical protein
MRRPRGFVIRKPKHLFGLPGRRLPAIVPKFQAELASRSILTPRRREPAATPCAPPSSTLRTDR